MAGVSNPDLDSKADPRPPPIRALLAKPGSAFARYRQLSFPAGSLFKFWLYELATMFLLPMPGGLGLMLRRKLLKPFFGSMGRNAIIGRNCTFRSPHHIFIGDDVVIDDNCLIDARGADEQGVRLADRVLLSRGVQMKSKGGPVHVGRDVNVGDNSLLVSQSGIHIGDGAAIATGCQIMGGTYATTEFNRPASQRTGATAGPIHIGAGTWLATGVIVLDGAQVGQDSIVAAGSVVTRSLPARCVAHGNPAKKVFEMR